ncbi:flavodoxin domain-containing protein [Marinospirillum minutulum]|uniref:flavodoxin domain-containing protein n=1 Tax=Marinospirillum minutulum TaxID=64974 RepID=UPI0003F9F5C5|nr:flavodoxin domain-containing protein [Marinospirillum minutulum]
MTDLVILVGSVYGGSVEVAEAVAEAVEATGLSVEINEEPNLASLEGNSVVLLVSSTTGSGELPENIQPFYTELQQQPRALSGRGYAVIALGDSSYGDSYCAGGLLLDAQFADLGAKALMPLLKIDALEFFQPAEGISDWLTAWLDALKKFSEKG